MTKKRVFLGGLPEGVTDEELQSRFSKFGTISSLGIKQKTGPEDNMVNTFAHMDIDITEESWKKCIGIYNKSKWKGRTLLIQEAKESFIDKLKKERESPNVKSCKKKPEKSETDDKKEEKPVTEFTVKGAKPGDPVDGNKNWIVGKYGRVMPIMHLRKKDRRKMVKVDPSKFVHHLKNLEKPNSKTDVKMEDVEGDLTWELTEDQREIVKLRKGEFPAFEKKKKKKSSAVEWYEQYGSHVRRKVKSDEPEFETVPVREIAQVQRVTNTGYDSGSDSAGSADTDEIISSKKVNPAESKGENSSEPSPVKGRMQQSHEVDGMQKNMVLKSERNGVSSSDDGEASDDDEDGGEASDDDEDGDEASDYDEDSDEASDDDEASYDEANSDSDDKENMQSVSKTHNVEKTIDTSRSGSRSAEKGTLNSKDASSSSGDDDDDDDDTNSDFSDLDMASVALTMSCPVKKELNKVKAKTSPEINVRTSVCDSNKSEILDKDKTLNNSTISKDGAENQRTSVKQSKQNKFKESYNSESEDSVGSSGTDEIIASAKARSNVSLKQESFRSFSASFDEYSSGLIEADRASGDSSSDEGDDILDEIASNTFSEKKLLKKTPASPVKSSEKKTSVEAKSSERIKSTRKASIETDDGVNDANTSCTNGDVSNVKKKKDKTKKSSSTGLSKIEKHELDNKKRLESVMQRTQENKSQKRLIQQALASVDKNTNNKRIVFDSDSEEENMTVSEPSLKESKVTAKPALKQQSSESDSSSDEESDSLSKKAQQQRKHQQTKPGGHPEADKNPTLFDSDSSDMSDSEDEDRFRLRPEYEGKAGKKLMRLQARYGNDERFKVDQRFLDSDSDEEADKEEESKPVTPEDADPSAAERQKSLQILDDVIGPKAVLPKKKTAKTFKDVSALHYDPTKEDHQQFEVQEEPAKTKKKKKKSKEKTETSQDAPEVSNDKFYDVNVTSLKDAFKGEDSQGFSLLSSFGVAAPQDNITQEEKVQDTHTPASKRDMLSWKPGFDADSSSEDEEISFRAKKDQKDHQDKGLEMKHDAVTCEGSSTFFFSENDPRLTEGVSFFYRHESLQEVRAKWEEEREDLVELFRMRRRRALKRERETDASKARGQRKFKKTH